MLTYAEERLIGVFLVAAVLLFVAIAIATLAIRSHLAERRAEAAAELDAEFDAAVDARARQIVGWAVDNLVAQAADSILMSAGVKLRLNRVLRELYQQQVELLTDLSREIGV